MSNIDRVNCDINKLLQTINFKSIGWNGSLWIYYINVEFTPTHGYKCPINLTKAVTVENNQHYRLLYQWLQSDDFPVPTPSPIQNLKVNNTSYL